MSNEKPQESVGELKNCPFCGDKPAVVKHDYNICVRCDNQNCGVVMELVASSYGQAVKDWNTRSPSLEQLEAENKALKENLNKIDNIRVYNRHLFKSTEAELTQARARIQELEAVLQQIWIMKLKVGSEEEFKMQDIAKTTAREALTTERKEGDNL